MNGDRLPDLAVSGAYLFGAGDGTFDGAMPYPEGASGTSVAIGDLDGDGVPDVALAGPGREARVLLN